MPEFFEIEPLKWVIHAQCVRVARTLMCLGEFDQALDLIQSRIEEVVAYGHSKNTADFLLLHAILSNNQESAERVLSISDDVAQRQMAYTLLCNEQFGDKLRNGALTKFSQYLMEAHLFN